MPGAPNRPPEGVGPAPPPPAPDPPERRLLRRLAPARVALSLDTWRGAPSPELLTPLGKAEAAFAAQDWRETESQLDALSIRLHEPRWPSIPPPFRSLRVAIPFPQPPQWDPEAKLAPPEREAHRARREAETQLALAQASTEFARTKGIEVGDLAPLLTRAAEALASGGVPAEFYAAIDPVWEALRSRVPPPKAGASRPVSPVASDPSAEEA